MNIYELKAGDWIVLSEKSRDKLKENQVYEDYLKQRSVPRQVKEITNFETKNDNKYNSPYGGYVEQAVLCFTTEGEQIVLEQNEYRKATDEEVAAIKITRLFR